MSQAKRVLPQTVKEALVKALDDLEFHPKPGTDRWKELSISDKRRALKSWSKKGRI